MRKNHGQFHKEKWQWRARVRREDLPSLTKSFPTKTLALKWSQRAENDPEKFLTERATAGHQLVTLGDLLRKYGAEVTLRKKGRDKGKYRIRILERSPLSGIPLKDPALTTSLGSEMKD